MAFSAERRRVTMQFEDLQGNNATTGMYIKTATVLDSVTWSTTIAALLDAFTAASVARGGAATLGCQATDEAAVAAAGAYQNVEDKAFLEFVSAGNNTVIYELPSPNSTVFETDSETVDPTDALIVEIVTQVLAFCADKAGNLIIGYVRGYRNRKKLQR